MAKVMLVEDDNNLREIYEARLQAEGYIIVSAHDGEEALVIAKAEKPDLIISDVMMPKISGFEMLDILRNTDGLKDVKIIMLTALGQADDQQRADKLGADRYLVKSQVTLEDIVKSAHELLGEETAPATPSTAPAPLTGTETAGSAAAPATPTSMPAPAEAAQSAATPSTPPAPAAPPAGSMPSVSSPQPTPAPQPAPAVAKPSAPPVTDAKDDKTAADDKVMAAAVDTLVADTEKKEEVKPAAEKVVEPPTADEEKPADNLPEPSQADEPAEADTANGHVKIANKKVITPIDTKPEKDIHALLAEEEAKEASQTPGTIADPSLTAAEAAVKQDATNTTAQEEAGVEAKIEDFVAGATTEPSAPNATATPKGSSDKTEKASSPAPATAVSGPAVTPIVISEDVPSGAPASSLSGNPGAPPSAAPAPSTKTTPPDPNNIAL